MPSSLWTRVNGRLVRVECSLCDNAATTRTIGERAEYPWTKDDPICDDCAENLEDETEDEKEYHAADRFLDALEAQWKTMSCAGELNEDGIDLRDVPYLALTEKLSEVATPTEMDELDGWGDDPMSFYVMKCLADKYGLEYPKNPPSPPGRVAKKHEEEEEEEETEEAKAAWAAVWAETNAIIEAHSSGAMTTEEAAEASERMKKGEAMAKWMALIHTPR